jgi:hypothetical protein
MCLWLLVDFVNELNPAAPAAGKRANSSAENRAPLLVKSS